MLRALLFDLWQRACLQNTLGTVGDGGSVRAVAPELSPEVGLGEREKAWGALTSRPPGALRVARCCPHLSWARGGHHPPSPQLYSPPRLHAGKVKAGSCDACSSE